MGPHVDLEAVGAGEGGTAVLADVGLVAAVGAHVDEEGGVLGVGGAAGVADEGTVSRVGPLVLLQVPRLLEAGAAVRALVRPVPSVHQRVKFELAATG